MEETLYIGVMSGTSLDGIDLVLAAIGHTIHPFKAEIRAFDFLPFEAATRSELLRLLRSESLPPAEMLGLHLVLGELFGEAVRDFLPRHGIAASDVRAVGLHGLTFQHLPDGVEVLGRRAQGTWQLGDAHTVRKLCGIPVIYDFRSADMAVGGQGAPLVPFLDQLYFRHERESRVLLNLGGIANMTLLSPGKKALAFDSGPANMIIDLLMEQHPTAPARCDADGKVAASGTVLPEILARCLAHPYFTAKAPKSTGRELFGTSFVAEYFSEPGWRHEDLVATATRLTARSVGDAVKQCLGRALSAEDRLICSGGGIHNPTLLEMLREEVAPMSVISTAQEGIDPDAKEALLMAALAWAHVQGFCGNLPEVTGATEEVILGSTTA